MEKPGRRVTVSTLAGAIVAVLAWLMEAAAGMAIPGGIESALTVIVMAVLLYIIHDQVPGQGGGNGEGKS